MKLIEKESISVCGFFTETSLETCGKDIPPLWEMFQRRKRELFDAFGFREDAYGLMWYTENHRYCYLMGILAEGNAKPPQGTCRRQVPEAAFAVAEVPPGMDAVTAWMEFFESAIPKSGHAPDTAHGMYFEYYPNGEGRKLELWAPVVKLPAGAARP